MTSPERATLRPTCQRVADFWDSVIAGFLVGEPTNVKPPLGRWSRAYGGSGRGEVDFTCFPEPYLGDILGQPRAAILSLNPGGVVPRFQAPDGIFANEIRQKGSYREWAKSWPYLREPWGYNSHHHPRSTFLQRWFGDTAFPSRHRIDFELFPWHSTAVTGVIAPDSTIIEEFVWEPLKELQVEFIFAFGRPWLDLLNRRLLPGIKVADRLGEGGRPYASSRKASSHTAVVKAATSWGTWLIIEKHSGSAGPPSDVETANIKAALGFE